MGEGRFYPSAWWGASDDFTHWVLAAPPALVYASGVIDAGARLLAPLAAAAVLAVGSGACASRDPASGFVVVRRYAAPDARQGVAVDAEHFYAISNRSIERYERGSGALVRRWQGSKDGPVVHLNSGIVLDGVLYCAHSNYPNVPMDSSIESFEAKTLRHLDSRTLQDAPGSATWVDRHSGYWWVNYAHYAGRGGVRGKGPEATTLVRYDDDWTPRGQWHFPASVVERFGRFSSSGGAWGPDGRLYVTGHDASEVYAMQLPESGSVLQLVAVLPAPIAGQGIAFAPQRPSTLWGIVKNLREVREMDFRGKHNPLE